LAARFSRPIDVDDNPAVTLSIHQSSRLLVGGEWPSEQIIKKEGASLLRTVVFFLFKEAYFYADLLPVTPRCASRGMRKPVRILSKAGAIPPVWDTYPVGGFLLSLAFQDQTAPALWETGLGGRRPVLGRAQG
jgi:hypothetical protein